MRLEDLTLEVLTKAVETYLELAYRGGTKPRWTPDLDMEPDAKPAQLLELFQSDQGQCDRPRYTMRLGNRNYPFMKLVLQEHIVEDSYQFLVDTHDEMEIKPDFPDYEAWMAVRRFNQDLKREIEREFESVGVPTSAALLEQVQERRAEAAVDADGEAVTKETILVVDDEEDLGETVETLLGSQGYAVHRANDGRKGLECALELQPDMILLDYEMPEMDGLEVIAALRKNVVTREIPVLLCTASHIGVEEIRQADGFLAKPYSEGLLYRMIRQVLRARQENDA